MKFSETVKRDQLVLFLDTFLNIKSIKDDSCNGLQVEGKDDIKKVIFAVDAGLETFEKAVEQNADMVVVHHGMFWNGVNPSVVSWKKKRIEMLLHYGISLYAAHLPLDMHPEVGNNAQLLSLLNFEREKPFGFYHGQAISFTGVIETLKTIDHIIATLKNELGAECKVLQFGKKEIKRIAVCSGGGDDYGMLQEAFDVGADLYLTGDATLMYHQVKDMRFNVIFAGHHATETVGVKALSQVVAKEFGIMTEFCNIPTGL